ncbi:MAG: T9SS type A sorting domain-containing protein [Flavobacteriales bacterium]|nr:T9SS type A sorting domain-containing protein [Flavobacteriales bacterium]
MGAFIGRLIGVLVVACFACSSGSAQDLEWIFEREIGPPVFDVSGVVVVQDRIFVIGDSGNPPVIYEIDESGAVRHAIHLANAQNTDWEELQTDAAGNLYIADTGNNLGYRTDLVIYRIPWFGEQMDQDTIFNVQEIAFSYADQGPNPQPDALTPFDCEAFVVRENTLQLFSKNRGLTGYTKRYELPSQPGQYVAQLTDSFPTPNWITGAASIDHEQAFLLSDNHLLTYQWAENAVSNPLTIPGNQVEGVCISNGYRMLLVEDVEDSGASMLYGIHAETIVSTPWTTTLYPNPTEGRIWIQSNLPVERIVIWDITGRPLTSQEFLWNLSDSYLDVYALPCGMYMVELIRKNEGQVHRVRVK